VGVESQTMVDGFTRAQSSWTTLKKGWQRVHQMRLDARITLVPSIPSGDLGFEG
jgi:hypothetical protein